jgi:uncharacterized protein YbaP (TraB family)
LLLAGVAAHADPAAWHVSNGRGGELWLLGSVHLLRAEDHPLPAVVNDLYAGADALAMELDLDDLDPLAMQAQLLGAAALDPSTTLREVLGHEAYEAARAKAQGLGVDLGLLGRFKPWLVAITLMELGMDRLGFRQEYGLEQYLLRLAKNDGKQIQGLESVATQVEVLDGLSFAAQNALLEQTLNELDTAGDMMHDLVQAWRDGRLEELDQVLMQGFEDFPALYESLVVARNERWIGALEALLASSESHLVVVGALHLTGDDSVVELLGARGLRVTPVR